MKKNIYYNPLDKKYKSVTGAIPENTAITFRVNFFDSVVFVCKSDDGKIEKRIEMQYKDGFSECCASFDVGLYWYYFELKDGRFISENNLYGELTDDIKNKFQLTVYEKNFQTPKWLKGGIIYQIFPDRFYSSGKFFSEKKGRVLHSDKTDIPVFLPDENGKVKNNDFFGGDLDGIIQKLPYLAELGVTAIYLNPIFSAYSNHRYDTSDYLKIDEYLGSEEDLNRLIFCARELGIELILDGVFNHTGDDSVYFNKYGTYESEGAFQSEKSPFYGWYKFIKYPSLYESWWGIDVLPATNKENEAFINFIAGKNGVIEHYVKLGIGGWRLDVVDELPSFFVKKIRERIKENNPNAVLIGEVWEDASNKISYGVRREYFQGKELDSVMNYPLKNAVIEYVKTKNVDKLAKVIREQTDHYPKCVLDSLMNVLATHDTFRLISAVSDKNVQGMTKSQMSEIYLTDEEYDIARERVKIATILQYTLYGVPSVYYGDEIGMQGYTDPLNRKFFDWDRIDEELRVFHVKIGSLRKSYSCFIEGETYLIYAKEGCVVYKRTDENSEILVAINLGYRNKYIKYDGVLCDALTGNSFNGRICLKEGGFGIFFEKK